MIRSIALVVLALGVAACSSTSSTRSSSNDAQTSAETEPSDPVCISFRDMRTGVTMELVNESHTGRVEQYSQVQNTASRKVMSDEIMGEFVEFLDDEGFDDDSIPGPLPFFGKGKVRWAMVIQDGDDARHVAESIDDEGRRRKRLEKYRAAFLQTYNAVQGWQAVQLEGGQSPFKRPDVKIGGVR